MKETDCRKCCVSDFKHALCKEDFCEKYYREGSAEDFEKLLPHWIPCTERLPETEEYVLCTTETKKGLRQVVRGYYMHDVKEWACGMNRNVLAWAPMPEPWKGEQQ